MQWMQWNSLKCSIKFAAGREANGIPAFMMRHECIKQYTQPKSLDDNQKYHRLLRKM